MMGVDVDLPADVLADVNRVTAQLTAVLTGDDACREPTVALNSAIRLLVTVIVGQQLDAPTVLSVLSFAARMHTATINQLATDPSGAVH